MSLRKMSFERAAVLNSETTTVHHVQPTQVLRVSSNIGSKNTINRRYTIQIQLRHYPTHPNHTTDRVRCQLSATRQVERLQCAIRVLCNPVDTVIGNLVAKSAQKGGVTIFRCRETSKTKRCFNTHETCKDWSATQCRAMNSRELSVIDVWQRFSVLRWSWCLSTNNLIDSS